MDGGITIEELAKTNDISIPMAARALINLIERDFVDPGPDREAALAELREKAGARDRATRNGQ